MSSAPPPSLFNDVLGPVMRGPSSSHSAASIRIGRLARALAGGRVDRATIEFDPHGSLATTHTSQGSDMGLLGGLLGWEADDERLGEVAAHAAAAGLATEFVVRDIGADHPNQYRLTVTNAAEGRAHVLLANSTGGGMIEVVALDGRPVSLRGDATATAYYLDDASGLAARLAADPRHHRVTGLEGLVVVEGEAAGPEVAGALRRVLPPVLPVGSRPGLVVPFRGSAELGAARDLDAVRLSACGLDYECARGAITPAAARDLMRRLAGVMRSGVERGLAGTSSPDRILGRQAAAFLRAAREGRLLGGSLQHRAIAYVTALMEAKSGLEVIVAAPTAGSCGTFPGTCLAAVDERGAGEDALLDMLFAGGLVGAFVAERSSFAAEVGGCQAETGAGAAMAAAALVDLAGGSARQALGAASLALQNVLGLVCDPVANRVEAPCLGRNVAGAANALASADMALAGYDALIPFDEVLDAHREISRSMARELRCTDRKSVV